MNSIADLALLAENAEASKFFGLTKSQALTLMAIAQAEGTHPACALRDYHVINGRPALRSDAMLARFHAAGGTVQWHELSDSLASATFSHAVGGSVKIEWTPARANQAGLGGNGMWKKYPRQMLRSRVVSEGIRTVYPAVICGFYAPEEVESFAPALAQPVANSGPLPPPIEVGNLSVPEPVQAVGERVEPISVSPSVWPAEVAAWLTEHEPAVNLFLVGKKWIQEDQTFRDLSETRAHQLMQRESAFSAAAGIPARLGGSK